MDLLQTAFERFKTRVFSQNIVPAKFHPRRACFEPNLDEPRTSIIKVIIEEQDDDHPRVSKEAYAIDISPDDPIIKIRIVFASGALRAFDSLAQLFYAHSRSEKDVYTPFAPVSIRDAPSFEHRGLMLDISRNRISSQDVLRTIDAMGFNKLNRLHLHATDSQSWPLEIPSLPTLAKEGAYAEDQIWSVEDLEKVQRYGLYRGVEVYLEIDMPGHTGSIVHAYPELVVAYNQRPWEKYAQEPPSGQLKLNSPEVGSFLTTLLNDLLPRVSTYNTRFHIGGDELNTEVYEMDCTVKSSEKRVIRPFLQKFMNEILSIVDSHSLTPHVWEDMLVDWALDFPSHTIFQNWRRGGLRKIVDQGYRAIFGESDEWYLDSGFGTFIDPIGEDSPIKHPFADWCPPYKNWRRVLAYNPLKDIPKEKQHLVIGGEVHLWTELTDSVTLDFMLWPRAAAAAEMMWRGGGEVGENTTRRLAVMRERLLKMGIRAGVVQMEWALRNPGECVL
jgi:hexosaminidase